MRLGYFALVSLLCAGTLAQTPHYDTMKIGASCPDFNLPGVDGRNYSLKDFAQAKVLAVVFTCDHCPTAQAYEERIKKLVAEYQLKGVAFVAINPNNPEAVRLD